MFNTNRLLKGFVLFAAIIFFGSFTGCSKQEAPKEEKAAEVKTQPEQTPQPPAEQPKVEEKKVLDLKGTYTGKFDAHATTLKITEQTDAQFSGTITINYREVINQKVSGEFNQEKMTLTMKDLLHSRYAGTYTAKVSEDGKTLSGTFTQTVDKTKLPFNLAKK